MCGVGPFCSTSGGRVWSRESLIAGGKLSLPAVLGLVMIAFVVWVVGGTVSPPWFGSEEICLSTLKRKLPS